MSPVLRNILAIILGWFGGSVINMGLITVGHSIMPIPNINPNDMQAIAAIMPTLSPEFFTFPFLGHALGTLVGAIISGVISKIHKIRNALIVGVIFLLGGIAVNLMLQGPLWFTITDITLAYIPMAWIGGKLAQRISKKT